MYLTAYKLTLETKMQWISSAKMELAASAADVLALGNDLDPENPAVKQLEAKRDKLVVLEKRLDIQQQEYQMRLDMIDKELESCEKALGKALENSFRY